MLKLLVRVLEKLPNELMHTNIIEILFLSRSTSKFGSSSIIVTLTYYIYLSPVLVGV